MLFFLKKKIWMNIYVFFCLLPLDRFPSCLEDTRFHTICICCQHTLHFNSHTGLPLTLRFSSCMFVSAKDHFVVSEQRSIAVRNDFLWKSDCYFNSRTGLSAVCLSVGLCVCPQVSPSALRGRRHFRRDRRVTGSIAKAIAPCQHSHLHWNWKQRGSWAAWQHCGAGDDTSQLLRTESVVALRSSIFLLTSFRSSFHLVWGFLGEDYKS